MTHSNTQDSEDRWSYFSLMRWLLWVGIVPIAYYFDWVYSVAFVAVCSLYANIASDFAAWRADRNYKINLILDKLNELEKKIEITDTND